MTSYLHRFDGPVDRLDRSRAAEEWPSSAHRSSTITRADGTQISLDALGDLKVAFCNVQDQWSDQRPVSDGWLAPRVHFALRITRSQASDPELWHWLAAVVWPDYVDWRWKSSVAENRWRGPIHKQSLARLWWSAEIFRDGADYTPVLKAWEKQDFVNSLLHRPLVRCRPFGLGILKVLFPEDGPVPSADQVNDIARVLNLCTAGSPPEARVGYQSDDISAALNWAASDAPIPHDWNQLPLGPPAFDTTAESIVQGTALARHGLELAASS